MGRSRWSSQDCRSEAILLQNALVGTLSLLRIKNMQYLIEEIYLTAAGLQAYSVERSSLEHLTAFQENLFGHSTKMNITFELCGAPLKWNKQTIKPMSTVLI